MNINYPWVEGGGAFVDGGPNNLGTIVTAKYLNDSQTVIKSTALEIKTVIDNAGITPNAAATDQLLKALKFISASDLDLHIGGAKPHSDYDLMMFGAIYPTILSSPPAANILFCQGQAFDIAKNPKLAQIFPNGQLPDLRERVLLGASTALGGVNKYIAQAGIKHSHTATAQSNTVNASGRTTGGGAHGHTAWTGGAGEHIHSAWTSVAPDHQHGIDVAQGQTVFGGPVWATGVNGAASATGWAGSHAHDIGIGAAGWHGHDVGVSAQGDHDHAFTVSIPSQVFNILTTSSGADKQRVDSYTINYMIKAA